MNVDRLVELAAIRGDYWRQQIVSPDFSLAGKVHDWRNHVEPYLQKAWSELSDTERLLVYLAADKQASDEEWE